MPREIRRGDVSVLVIMHAYQLRRQTDCVLPDLEKCEFFVYSSRPGRAMSSRMASLGLLLWWRISSICWVMGISTA
jgi:hypothetical protein